MTVKPAANIGGIIEVLPHGAHGVEGATRKGGYINLQILAKTEVELNRAFDEVAAIGRVIEEATLEDSVDEEAEVEIAGGPEIAKGLNVVCMGKVTVGEVELEHFLNEVGAGGGSLEGEVDDIVTGPGTGFAKDSFWAGVVNFVVVGKFGTFFNAVTGECAGGFLDVVLGIIPFTEDKELEEFTGKIFVGFARRALIEVKVANHGGFATDAFTEVRIIELDALTKGFFVILEEEGLANFTLLNDENIVQKGHEFFLRAVGFIAGKTVPLDGILAEETFALAADIALGFTPFFAIFYAVNLSAALEEFVFKARQFGALGEWATGGKGGFDGFRNGAVERLSDFYRSGGVADAAQEVSGCFSVPVCDGKRLPGIFGR